MIIWWQSDVPVSKVNELRPCLGLLVRIKSIHLGLSNILKQAGSRIRIFKPYMLQTSWSSFSIGSELESTIPTILSYPVPRMSIYELNLVRCCLISELHGLYTLSPTHFGIYVNIDKHTFNIR